MDNLDIATFISGFGFGMMTAAWLMKKQIKKYKLRKKNETS